MVISFIAIFSSFTSKSSVLTHSITSWLLTSCENLLPSSTFALGSSFFISDTLVSISLASEVQNGMIVYSLKSQLSKNVYIIFGSFPHQIGYPIKIVLYFSTAILFLISGLELGSYCSWFALE